MNVYKYSIFVILIIHEAQVYMKRSCVFGTIYVELAELYRKQGAGLSLADTTGNHHLANVHFQNNEMKNVVACCCYSFFLHPVKPMHSRTPVWPTVLLLLRCWPCLHLGYVGDGDKCDVTAEDSEDCRGWGGTWNPCCGKRHVCHWLGTEGNSEFVGFI